MALARRPARRPFLTPVTILSNADWDRIKRSAKTIEETTTEQQFKYEKAYRRMERMETEEQVMADAKNKLFCGTESVRRFHTALMYTKVMKEREVQVEMKQKMHKVETERLEMEELQRNRELAAHQEFQTYTEGVIAAAAEANLNLIPLLKAAGEGSEMHGPVLGGIPILYKPVFEKGKRVKVKKDEASVVDVGLSGLGFTFPEKTPEYEYPDLSSKRIGRATTVLVAMDPQDMRVNFPVRESEPTKFMAEHWSQKTDRN